MLGVNVMGEIIQRSKYEKDFIERTYSSIVTDISIAFSELVAILGTLVQQRFQLRCLKKEAMKSLLKIMEQE